jgi:hypothetical protein
VSNKGSTEYVVTQIEALLGIIFGREQRVQVGELLRKYRSEHVFAALANLRDLAKKSGTAESSEKFNYNRDKEGK